MNERRMNALKRENLSLKELILSYYYAYSKYVYCYSSYCQSSLFDTELILEKRLWKKDTGQT